MEKKTCCSEDGARRRGGGGDGGHLGGGVRGRNPGGASGGEGSVPGDAAAHRGKEARDLNAEGSS